MSTSTTREGGVSNPPEGRVATALSISVPVEVWDTTTTKSLVRWQAIYSLGGLIAGLATLCIGGWLVTQKVSDNTSWELDVLWLVKLKLSATTPGIVVSVIGALVVLFSRFSVTATLDRVEKNAGRT